MKTASCGFLLLAFSLGGAAGARLSAQSAPVVKGRLVDGSQMLRAGRQKGVNSRGPGFDEGVARIPVAEKEFRLDLVHPDFKAQLWRGRTDAEGRFELVLNGVTRLPASACLVASVVSEALYSTTVMPLASGETEFRLYGVSDDERSLLNNIIQVRFTLVDAPGGVGKLLDVRIDLLASNFVGDLFVGRPHVWADSPQSRAVFRIPLPDGAKVVSNQTFAPLPVNGFGSRTWFG